MECLTSSVLRILLRFALDTERVEKAVRTLLAKSHVFGPAPIVLGNPASSFEMSRGALDAWFAAVVRHLETIHTHVNIDASDSGIGITDCLRIPITSKEDQDALAAICTQWRDCFETSKRRDDGIMAFTCFKAHDEAVRIVRRIPLVRVFFTIMHMHTVPNARCMQRLYTLHMHAQLRYTAQRAQSQTLSLISERTAYAHIEAPFPTQTDGEAAEETNRFAVAWVARRERVQELYAAYTPGMAQVHMARRIAAGRIVFPRTGRTLHASVAELVERATHGDIHPPASDACASALILPTSHAVRVPVTETLFAILAVIHDAHEIMQTETDVSKRWCNACVPHTMLCSAMTLLLGAHDAPRGRDMWIAMMDVCTLNGAERDDIGATLPFISPFELPDTGGEPATVEEHARIAHILSVIATMQRFPHAFEISLTTWVYVSMCCMAGARLEPTFLNSSYLADVINAFLVFEPMETVRALAPRVIRRLAVNASPQMMGGAPVHHVPTDVFYNPLDVLRVAMQHGEIAHSALIHAYVRAHATETTVTFTFASSRVSAMDIHVSWGRFHDERYTCVVFETLTTTSWTMTRAGCAAYRAWASHLAPHAPPHYSLPLFVWHPPHHTLESSRYVMNAHLVYATLEHLAHAT